MVAIGLEADNDVMTFCIGNSGICWRTISYPSSDH